MHNIMILQILSFLRPGLQLYICHTLSLTQKDLLMMAGFVTSALAYLTTNLMAPKSPIVSGISIYYFIKDYSDN